MRSVSGRARRVSANLQNEALVGGGAHLARGVAENGKGAREAVRRPERPGLCAQGLELVGALRDRAAGALGYADHVGVAQVGGQLARELQRVPPLVHEPSNLREELGGVATGNRQGNLSEHGMRDLPEHLLRRREAYVARAEHGELLEGGEGVAHAAARVTHDELERGLLVGEPLLATDVGEVSLHLVVADGMEVKALHSARLDRREEPSAGRSCTCTKTTCSGGSSSVLSSALNAAGVQHVHLVDDVDLGPAAHRGVAPRGR